MRTRRRRLTIGSSTGPVVSDSGESAITLRQRRAHAAPAAEELPTVGLPFQFADRLPFDREHVRKPDVGSSGDRGRRVASSVLRSTTHSVWTKRFENAGWSASAAGRREHDLGVRGHLDLASGAPRGW